MNKDKNLKTEYYTKEKKEIALKESLIILDDILDTTTDPVQVNAIKKLKEIFVKRLSTK